MPCRGGATTLGAALVGAAAAAAIERGRARVMLEVNAWPGWATIAGIGLLYVGARGARR